MHSIAQVLIIALVFFACGTSQDKQEAAPGLNVRIAPVAPPLTPVGDVPSFNAPLTEALLQPGDQFPLGTYASREFGCCGPRHLGHDFKAAAGTPVRALASGVVLPAPMSGPHCNFGYVVIVWSRLLDGTDFTIEYGHLSGRTGLRPTLSGIVHRGDIIGYVGHDGGVSPSGARCGTDDENGDGAEHAHIGVRLAPPATDQNNVLQWVYYGYAGHGEDVDVDTNGTSHGGSFTSVVNFANGHGTHAGMNTSGTWDRAISPDVASRYCASGGYKMLGDSVDYGRGNGLALLSGNTWCQKFRTTNLPIVSTGICTDKTASHAYELLQPIWQVYSTSDVARLLGSPTDNTVIESPNLTYQMFDTGRVEITNNAGHFTTNNGNVYALEGNGYYLVSESWTPPPSSASGSSSGGASSSTSGTMPSSSSSAASSTASSAAAVSNSSSASHASSQPAQPTGPDPNQNDPPYTDCALHGFNLVVNGDFRLHPLSCGWMLENALGGGHAEQSCDATGECRARVWTTTPLDPWRTQIKTYVRVLAGRHYVFRMKVRAENMADRFIVQLMKEDSPWQNYGLWIDTEIPAGIEQTFNIPFIARTNDDYARLTFQFGQTSTVFTIDKVWLEEVLAPGP